MSANEKKAPERWVRSTCPYCGVGCGVEVGVKDGRVSAIRGDKSHPANFGKLCPKPAGLPEAIHAPNRLTHPLRRNGKGDLERISWDAALNELAEKLGEALHRHGPRGAAFYISGQLLTEDYYAVNKFAKGFLGTNNLDSNSRLCMTSAVSGYKGAFGSDGPPASYADITRAECFLLWGTNTAECHPVTFGRIKERKKDPAVSVVVVDPRRTPTVDVADLHLPIRPGTDLALANAMLWVLVEGNLLDRDFISRHTTDFEDAAAVAREWPPELAARVCGVPREDIVRTALLFGESGASMSLWTMGVNQSAAGTKKNRAIINLHLATGNVGRPGAGPFSLTGQPNAMGGREVGGLCAGLPGYRSVEDVDHRREVEEAWCVEPGSISETPGLPATEMFRALERGETKLMWVVATNPAVSMPDLSRAKRALANAEFLVVQDAYPTETTRYADLVLPAAQWGEKAGTMTNSERRVSLVEKVVEPVGEARADWEIFADVARRMGFGDFFGWEGAAAVFDEFKGLTRGTPAEMTGLSRERLRERPVQWPVPEKLEARERPSGVPQPRHREDEHPGTPRLYVDGRFNTPDGKARFASTPHEGLREEPTDEYPLVLSTGRIKNQWHTMTRTGLSGKLTRGLDGPFVEIHPDAAERARIRDGEPTRIVSARGSFVATARVTEEIEPGTVFAPFHWGDLWTDGGSLNETTHDAVDPVSKEPELKGAAVRVEAVEPCERAEGVSMSGKLKVVVVGNGIAGAALVDALLDGSPGGVEITLYGAEEVGTYDRVRLSEYMAGAVSLEDLGMRPREWYEERGIDLRLGVRVEEIDTEGRRVRGDDGEWVGYDRLVLAIGSEAFVPPIPGREKKGVFVFRTVEDVERMLAAAPKSAVVIGGGLLGLEAAYGLVVRGARVTVLDLANHLMSQQLDEPAGIMLRREIGKLGVEARLGARTEEILGNGRTEGVRLGGGDELAADMVVVCAGIRPNADLAREAGIETNRGIMVDDNMRTSAEGVYAVGECAEHDGMVYGLVTPALEQVRVAARDILGGQTDPYRGSVLSATLKVMGVDVTSAGDVYGRDAGCESLVSSNPLKGVYRKAVIRDGKIVGTVLLGDTAGTAQLKDAVRREAPAEEVADLILGSSSGEFEDPPLPDDAQVCGCNGVSKGQVVVAIREKGCNSVSAVGEATRAGTGCGSCKPLVKEILAETAEVVEEEKNYLCPCLELTQADIKGIIRGRGLRSVSEVGAACGAGKVCTSCKPKLAFVVEEVNLNRQREERHARLINDRVHGNIQNDGTFSIVPRTRGGVTNPDELRRIADVAEKYNARMVKITGAQRLDILGVKKEDLPRAWADLDMPSGHAYTKALRQVKTCVGTEFCRYGVGDSTKLGIEIEEALENLYTPAKVKLGCSGCPRNCAEASVKDIGLIAIEGGWQIYVGGAAGKEVRKGDVIATVGSEAEAMRLTRAFFQYYRENAEYGERTYDFVPRVGLEEIRAAITDDEVSEGLLERLERAKEVADDPWKERDRPVTANQFVGTIGRK